MADTRDTWEDTVPENKRRTQGADTIVYGLNLGSGNWSFPFWETIDLKAKNPTYRIDLDKNPQLPYPDRCCRIVYTSNLLYYLTPISIQQLLNESYRILKFEGYIHIAVADNDLEIGRRTYDNDLPTHKTRLNFMMLKEMLMNAGFTDIRKLRFRETRLLVPFIFDRVPDRSMYVEARKP